MTGLAKKKAHATIVLLVICDQGISLPEPVNEGVSVFQFDFKAKVP